MIRPALTAQDLNTSFATYIASRGGPKDASEVAGQTLFVPSNETAANGLRDLAAKSAQGGDFFVQCSTLQQKDSFALKGNGMVAMAEIQQQRQANPAAAGTWDLLKAVAGTQFPHQFFITKFSEPPQVAEGNPSMFSVELRQLGTPESGQPAPVGVLFVDTAPPDGGVQAYLLKPPAREP